MFKKIITLFTFHTIFSFFSLQAQTFLEELQDLNDRYRNGISYYEQRSVGNVPIVELNKINEERFSLIAGVGRQIRQDCPTKQEWREITESVWQQAACLLEKEEVYNDKTGFKEVGLKSEVSSLVQLIIGGQSFEDLDQAHQDNALALLSGTFYALELLTSSLPKIDFWEVAGLGEYKPADLFDGDFKIHMGDHFRTVYRKLRMEQLKLDSNAPKDDKKTLSQWGHFTFAVSFDAIVEADFTTVIRTYVTRGYEKQEQSPFYGARVGPKEKIEIYYSNLPVYFQGQDVKDFNTPLKPLIASEKNASRLLKDKAQHWLTGEDFRRNELSNQFAFTTISGKNTTVLTQFHFTLKKEKSATRFTNKIPGEYIFVILNSYMIYPHLQGLNYSDKMIVLS